MARRRKRHVQQEMTFRTHGGRRAGAGRKQVKPRKSEPHRPRLGLAASNPVHVVLRVERDIGSLRKRDCFLAIRFALGVVLGRPDFRIVHISIQRTHIHLLVEATDEKHLARGLQAFQISAARALNAAITRRGVKRRGRVFVDRYHPEVITNPRQARHCLSYVLNNWRKHRENERYVARTWKLDPYSSAMAFYGWAEQPAYWNAPEGYERLLVAMPETWLLHGALERYEPISIYDVPASS
ncbi:MAG: transposase [Deltaproteobacteria bacterium]|nr:transposase [Deltaproteobacteria bacterium]